MPTSLVWTDGRCSFPATTSWGSVESIRRLGHRRDRSEVADLVLREIGEEQDLAARHEVVLPYLRAGRRGCRGAGRRLRCGGVAGRGGSGYRRSCRLRHGGVRGRLLVHGRLAFFFAASSTFFRSAPRP